MSTGALNKIKAVHIHTDLKFVRETRLFEGDQFKNQIIIIGEEKTYEGDFADDVRFVNRNYLGLKKIIHICNRSELVVLYDLDPVKSAIANSVSDHVRIAWRFFGYELYKRDKDKYISASSLAASTDEENENVLNDLKSRISWIKPVNLFFDSSFEKAASRIDYFLCLSRMEYDELLLDWPELPECIEIPLWDEFNTCQPEELWRLKDPVLLLGNNKSIYNNHLDAIKEVNKSAKASDYRIIVPFSYGSEGDYTKAVRFNVRKKNNYTLLEEFLPYHEYEAVIRRSFALVINSYRQIGMDTIYMAIKNGVKVYLNRKNIIYRWLKSKGVKVFHVKLLVSDLDSGEIRLSISEIESNIKALHALQGEYPKSEFQKTMARKIRDRERHGLRIID